MQGLELRILGFGSRIVGMEETVETTMGSKYMDGCRGQDPSDPFIKTN